MKKLILVFVFFTGMIFLFSVSDLLANSHQSSQQIAFSKATTDSSQPRLRSPTFIPVSGWFDDDTETIVIQFLQDLGDVTINVEGATYNTIGAAGTTEYIYFPGNDPGVYTITIQCASGIYVGCIFIN